MLDVNVSSVCRWAEQYEHEGWAGLEPAGVSGRPPKLTPRQAEKVLSWVRQCRPQDLGFATDSGTHWTARRVASVIKDRLGVRFQPPVPQRLAFAPWDQPAVAAARPARAGRQSRWSLASIRLAGHKKGAIATGATPLFTDETGLLMAPLLRTTLAERGHTPRIELRARQRDKVSVVAALWKTPGPAGLIRLAFRTYPDQFINNQRYAQFLEDVMACRLRTTRVIVIHDRGGMHKGDPVEELLTEINRLSGFEFLPPYAPELNPVEEVWNWLKYDELSNFAPTDVEQLDRVINAKLYALNRDQPRLRTFLAFSPLKW